MADEDKNDIEDTSRYLDLRVQLAQLGIEDLLSG